MFHNTLMLGNLSGSEALKCKRKLRNPNKILEYPTVGACENGIVDSIPILILGNHRFQNFWKGTYVKIALE